MSNFIILLKKLLLKFIVYCVSNYYLRKPDKEEFLSVRLDSFVIIGKHFINEACFIGGFSSSRFLTSLNIEPTNMCNLLCEICPSKNEGMRIKGMMDMALFEKIIGEGHCIESVQFSQWGEPLLHPEIHTMILRAQHKGMKTLLTTNGILLESTIALQLLKAGLSRITFSIDGIGGTYTKIRGASYDLLKKNILDFKKLRDKHSFSTKIDISMVVCKDTEGDIEKLQSEFTGLADRIQFIPIFTYGKRSAKCRELWRGSLTVFWDGVVTPCCVDYEGKLAIGDTKKDNIIKIFNSPSMKELRRLHSKNRFPTLCNSCKEYAAEGISPRFS